ncbi:hypothetical protein HYV11_02005 [Candidatus Dependentiae bacterium]|nr:hypothetical protein [Candidatus Dependentiae bacterium]
MSKKLTALQAYQIMLHFFDSIYFQTYDDDLGSMMSGAALYSIDSVPMTMDPAVWDDWMESIKMVLNDSRITFDTVELTIDQAYAAVGQYLIIYSNIGFFESIGVLRDILVHGSKYPVLAKWLKCKWMQAVDSVGQKKLSSPIEHLFTEETELTLQESFMIMQIFLNMLSHKIQDIELIKLVKDSRMVYNQNNDCFKHLDNTADNIWNAWNDAINFRLQQLQSNKLNLLVTYQALSIFLNSYFKIKSVAIAKLIKQFKNDDSKQFVHFSFSEEWFNAVSSINAKQIEKRYNLKSINTAISIESAFVIINNWLNNHQFTLIDRELLIEMVHNIQRKQRSYLLCDDKITVLEAYQVMVFYLEKVSQNKYQDFALNKDGKLVHFLILLEWLYTVEQFFDINEKVKKIVLPGASF